MCLKHLEYKLRNTSIRSFPFDHMVVEGIFPSPLFRDLLEALPPFEMYERPERPGSVIGDTTPLERERTLFSLSDSSLSRLSFFQSYIWRQIRDSLLSPELTEVLIDVFSPTLKLSRGSLPAPASCYSRAMVIRDVAGYAIGPHTDVALRLFSAIFYLARDSTCPEWGTALYSPKKHNFTDPVGRHLPREDFDLVTIAPYLPNTMFIFPRSDISFHGVEEITEGHGYRDILLYDIRLSSDPSV